MERARKMMLVPADAWNAIRSPEPTFSSPHTYPEQSIATGPATFTIYELEKEMSRVLNDKEMNDHDKWTVYYQTLEKYFKKTDSARKPLTLPIVKLQDSGDARIKRAVLSREHPEHDRITDECSNSLSEEHILAPLPKTFKSKAIRFLNWIRATDAITWDAAGAVYINGVKIPRSNIADLVSDYLRNRTTVGPAKGWYTFGHALRELNVPRDFIGNTLRWKALHQLAPIYEDDYNAVERASAKSPKLMTRSESRRLEVENNRLAKKKHSWLSYKHHGNAEK